MAYNNRDSFWFGTEQRMKWFRGPLKGGESNSEAWLSSGVLLNGGGWSFGSRGSHKNYRFEWGTATPIKYAQEMKSYFDGSYGRGLIYFIDPLIYEKNILPARWADPGMALDYEGGRLVYGVEPTPVTTTNVYPNDIPRVGARYDLTLINPGFRGKGEALFVPIPQGYTLGLGAIFGTTGSGGIFVTPMYPDGTMGSAQPLTNTGSTSSQVINATFSDSFSGVWLWVGKSSTGAASVTAHAMTARLMANSRFIVSGPGYGLTPYGQTPYGGSTVAQSNPSGWRNGPWIGGMGHSGCRFEGPPTFAGTGPLGGGQAGFAAGFREVGSWNYG